VTNRFQTDALPNFLVYRRALWGCWRHENISGMGAISRAVDKLPTWVQAVIGVVAVLMSVYSIAHYGFFSFLMHMIFSPNP
jgi:hypothetical protein